MLISVHLFGHYSDYARDPISLDVPQGSTVREVAEILAKREPRLIGVAKCRAAINAEYCAATDSVKEGDEVAFIPPMSGG